MNSPWISFAVVNPHWACPSDLVLPFDFGQGVTLREIPSWVRKEDSHDLLRVKLQQRLGDVTEARCFAVEYEAQALGSPDPKWQGAEQRSIQETATESLRSANLALWLVRPSPISFEHVAHAASSNGSWVTRQLAKFDPLVPLPTYSSEPLSRADFESARQVFQGILSLPPQGTLRTATHSTLRALTESGWTLRFLVLWLVVESLFGPEDAREITFRLSQRMALFLEIDRKTARSLFNAIKESYTWRSKVVHGLRLAKLTPEKSQVLLTNLELWVRRSLAAVLSDDGLRAKFESKTREEYLDELVFR